MASVTIYTRRWCGYCTGALRLLTQKDVAFEEIDTTGNHELRRWLARNAGGRTTVPQIFIDGRSIGGYDELAEMDASGELATLTQAAG